MQTNEAFARLVVVGLILLLAIPPQVLPQASSANPTFKPEELDQLLAPIALYPDALLAQIFMASTYPLEVVQADRWVRQNQQLQGDALTAALEKQPWDPSVKSLVNFSQVLAMMSEQLDWTTKLGDAVLAQQKDVMNTVQRLRVKAQEAGNLKTTTEQTVIVEQQVIRIESPSPQVVYVPAYNPTVVYGAWAYPTYPPYAYYPPGYVAGAAAFSFAAGVAVGAAWGYAWGGCNWHRGDVDIDINRNVNINQNINRNVYQANFQRSGQISTSGSGTWQHNATHRKGVAYRDQATAQQFNRATSADAVRARESYRGRAEAGRQDLARGGAAPATGRQDLGRGGTLGSPGQVGTSSRQSAFEGIERGGAAQTYSNRGQASRASMAGGGGSRGGGARGGGGRR